MKRRCPPAVGAWGAIALLMTLCTAPAIATDEVGLFFDDAGEAACAEVEAYSTVTLYLLLLQPSAGSVSGWECELDYENVTLTGTVLAGQALNVVQAPRFQVGIGGVPLTGAGVIELARFTFLVLGSGQSAFYIYPFSPPSIPDSEVPVYADGADPTHLIPMTPHSLSGGAVVAGVNLPECITLDATWGRIKQVYED